jgi:heme A synthase
VTTHRHRIAVEEAVVYGFLTALGAYAFITAFDYDILNEGNRVGPGLIPAILGGLIALISAVLLVLALIGHRAGHDHGLAEVAQSVVADAQGEAGSVGDGSAENADPDAGTADDLDIFGRTPAQRMRQLQMVTVALAVSLLLVPLLGLLGALGLFCLFASIVVERRPWLSSVVITVVSIGVIYGLFSVFLEVPLPTGVLGIGG